MEQTTLRWNQAGSQTWFEVVQVRKRHASGCLSEWYDGNRQHEGSKTARAELKRLRQDYPEIEYALVKRNLIELR